MATISTKQKKMKWTRAELQMMDILMEEIWNETAEKNSKTKKATASTAAPIK